MMAALPTGSWIGGAWLDGASRVTVDDPGDGTSIIEIARADVATCMLAVDAASSAFASWRATAPRARAEILRRAYDLMIAEADFIAELIVRENGKVLTDAKNETVYAAEFFRWFSEEAVRLDGDLRKAPGGANWIAVARQPVGVALLLSPWNFPAAMLTCKIGPALAAGCTVVLKPAAETPLTAVYLVDLLHRAGVPAGVVNLVVPDPPGPAVEAMIGHPATRKLSFTGSTPVGKLLLTQAARRVVNCSMELGGNAPFVVLADADVDAAIEGAMIAKMRNGGAACTAANRFIVDNAVADEFAEKLCARMTSLVVGYGLDPASQVGALVNAGQQTRVNGLVERAVDVGARVVGQGSAPTAGCFVAPIVLDHVGHDNNGRTSDISSRRDGQHYPATSRFTPCPQCDLRPPHARHRSQPTRRRTPGTSSGRNQTHRRSRLRSDLRSLASEPGSVRRCDRPVEEVQ